MRAASTIGWVVNGSVIRSPVVVDGVVSDEKLGALLALETEYAELDFKRSIDLTKTRDLVELAKDVGAMQVRGGYIVVGVDGDGTACGELDASQKPHFDEATLTPKLRKYLPSRLEVATRWFDNAGSPLALIYVGAHPSGCAIFKADGQYEGDAGNTVGVFRAGEIFWHNGTRSERLNQDGLEEVMRRRVQHEKAGWIAEREEVYRQALARLEAAYESRSVAVAPLGALSFDLNSESLTAAAIELVRRQDTIPLTKLLADATNVAQAGCSSSVTSRSSWPMSWTSSPASQLRSLCTR